MRKRKIKNKEYEEVLLEVKKSFPQAKLNSARGHELHIRVTNVSIEDGKSFIKNIPSLGLIQDKRYSTSYLTHFITKNNLLVPVVISCGEYKVNKKDSLTQKQLTPTKLNIIGDFDNINDFLEVIKNSLNQVNPQLNSSWSSENKKELTDLLRKLTIDIVFKNQILTDREKEIIKHHKSSIGKDFGEVLTAVYLLNKYKNVSIALSESACSFDLSFSDESGIINKFNTKSGNGSGQTFKSIKKEYNGLDYNDYKKGSPAHVCLEMIKSLIDTSKGNIKGKDRIFNLANSAMKINNSEKLYEILKEISKMFFNDKEIKKENYNPPNDFSSYANLIKSLWEKLSLRKIGLPSGSHEEKPDVFYESNIYGKENAILFTMSTLICAYFPEKVITNIMEKLLKTKIHVIHLNLNEKGVSFTSPDKISYKFHYWGNFKNPTNNLPGFKTIYSH